MPLRLRINKNHVLQYLYILTIGLDPFVNDISDLCAVLLKVTKVTVTKNTSISKLDPFGGHTSLLQEVDNTMFVGDVRAGTTSERNVLDFGNLCELVDCSRLHVAAALRRCIVADKLVSELGSAVDSGLVCDPGIRHAPKTSGRTSDR